jgi:nitrate/nitrite transporter NarK
VKENMVGTAFGLMSALQNFGLFMMPLIVGQLRQTSGSYQSACIVFSTLSAISCIAGEFTFAAL